MGLGRSPTSGCLTYVRLRSRGDAGSASPAPVPGEAQPVRPSRSGASPEAGWELKSRAHGHPAAPINKKVAFPQLPRKVALLFTLTCTLHFSVWQLVTHPDAAALQGAVGEGPDEHVGMACPLQWPAAPAFSSLVPPSCQVPALDMQKSKVGFHGAGGGRGHRGGRGQASPQPGAGSSGTGGQALGALRLPLRLHVPPTPCCRSVIVFRHCDHTENF